MQHKHSGWGMSVQGLEMTSSLHLEAQNKFYSVQSLQTSFWHIVDHLGTTRGDNYSIDGGDRNYGPFLLYNH